MPGREVPLVSQEYYHIFNRGVAKQTTFSSPCDYRQATLDLNYYRFLHPPLKLSRLKQLEKCHYQDAWNSLLVGGKKLVEIVCYVFMPNHWHILLRQETDGGIAKFVSNFSNSYTRYYNTRHTRVGPLFQGSFKSVLVETEEQLLHVSRYIHLNPVSSGIIKLEDLANYQWSSYPHYQSRNPQVFNSTLILKSFSHPSDYTKFVHDQVDNAEKLFIIKDQVIDYI
jgi:putative transposase